MVVKISSRSLCRNASFRGFHTRSRILVAQNFTMPAMSPTMTEGNIASWKVKEGDSFVTGDVLLEIETDKAQMDVEAQDEGKMAKIMQKDGAKGVKVGTRIAVLAEADDDLSTLSIPAEDSKAAPSPQEDLKSGIDPSKSSGSQAEAPPSSKSADGPSSSSSQQSSTTSKSSGKPIKQTYPLYPSIAQLLHEKGIPISEADKIPASGPKGRLLKGDVLSYLGSISSSYSSDQSVRISNLTHLDLSKITLAPPKPMAPPPTSSDRTPLTAALAADIEIAVSISLNAVLEVQKRIQATLGITLPLSTFIARATEVANDDLPRSATSAPSSDELFNQILGLDKISPKTSRGSFTPQITALPLTPFTRPSAGPPKRRGIIDILTDTGSSMKTSTSIPSTPPPPPGIMAGINAGAATNVFSVSVGKGEEKRARVFLERVKTILQVEPGRLVL